MKRRRILTIIACGVLALLLALIFSTRRHEGVPVSAINAVQTALVQEGFKAQPTTVSVNEIALPRIPGVRFIVSTFHPGYRKQRENHGFLKDGAKLGVDYDMVGKEGSSIWLSCDPVHGARMRQVARELSALNPNLSIWMRTNEPPIATNR